MYDLLNQMFRLFNWAWNWELPLSGFHIYPVQLGICVFCVEVLIDSVIPTIKSMITSDKGGDP